MTFDTGHPAPLPERAHRAGRRFDQGVPAGPPPEVLAAVEDAWQRVSQLADDDREVHFGDDAGGRLTIELRTLGGEVLERLAPSGVFAVLDGTLP